MQFGAEEPGRALKRLRERLHLRYRDVAEASQRIANQRGSDEFIVGLSRLADIENKGTMPSIYRLYSLCAIYALDFNRALEWYGVNLAQLTSDAAKLGLDRTHPIEFSNLDGVEIELPTGWAPELDLRRTSYLSRSIQSWGKLPVALLNSLDLRKHRYGFIGTDDWAMYPIIAPGAFVQIDETRRKIAREGWANEYERPIYFVEHRNGYSCGWCTLTAGVLIVQPHSSAHASAEFFRFPGEVDVIGQVVGVAMRLDLGKRRHIRS